MADAAPSRRTSGEDTTGASLAVRVVRLAAPLGMLPLILAIAAAFAEGAPLGAQGAEIATFAWGVVTFVDLGLALVLGWAWIAWREASPARAALWLVLTTLTGSIALLGYLAGAAWRSRRMSELLIGPRRRSA
jgi:hypothetical protein